MMDERSHTQAARDARDWYDTDVVNKIFKGFGVTDNKKGGLAHLTANNYECFMNELTEARECIVHFCALDWQGSAKSYIEDIAESAVDMCNRVYGPFGTEVAS